MDRDTLSLPVANSQFYTNAVSSLTSMLSPIAQAPNEKENKDSLNISANSSVSAPSTSTVLSTPNTPVFELMEEVRTGKSFSGIDNSNLLSVQLTPKRPLRSEAEKEKRLSRTQSIITNCSNTPSKVDNASVSGDSSNSRNSISELKIERSSHKFLIFFLFISHHRLADIRRRFPSTATPHEASSRQRQLQSVDRRRIAVFVRENKRRLP